MIKKLVSHLGEYKRAAVLTPLFAALEAVMDVLLPTIMAFIIDQGIEKGDMNAILKYGLLTFLVAVVALALGVLAGKYAAEASTGFAGNLRDAMYLLFFCVARTAFNMPRSCLLNASPFASMMFVGFATKSIAPRSMAKMVTSASLLSVSVLTITTFARMPSFCNFSSNCSPSMRGIFTSRTTPS